MARPVGLECPQKDLCTQGHPGREKPALISVGGNRCWVLELGKGLHLACCVALSHGEKSRSSGALKTNKHKKNPSFDFLWIEKETRRELMPCATRSGRLWPRCTDVISDANPHSAVSVCLAFPPSLFLSSQWRNTEQRSWEKTRASLKGLLALTTSGLQVWEISLPT